MSYRENLEARFKKCQLSDSLSDDQVDRLISALDDVMSGCAEVADDHTPPFTPSTQAKLRAVVRGWQQALVEPK